MFSNSGAPSALYKYIQELKAEVEEKKRQIKKEEEINNSLQEEHCRKNEAIRHFQENSRQLDYDVKQIHDVYLNQKEALERIKESTKLLNKQLEMKVEQVEKRREENLQFRMLSEEKLKRQKEKFDEYMDVYKTFPGVQEYLQLQERFGELCLTESNISEGAEVMEREIGEMRALKNRQVMAQNDGKYRTLSSWGVALAKNYKAYVEEQQTISKLRLEVEERKARIARLKEIKQQEKESKKRALEEAKRKEIDEQISSNITPSRSFDKPNKAMVKTRKLLDFSKMSSMNFKDFLHFGNKTPVRLRASVPNLTWKSSDFSTESFKLPVTIGTPKCSPYLPRAKSMSVLAKRSGDAVVESSESNLSVPMPSTPSLQKWLATTTKSQNETQGSKEREEAMDVEDRETSQTPVSELQDLKDREGQAENQEILSQFTEQEAPILKYKDARSPPLQPNTFKVPVKSPAFVFPDMCKSPENDFKFSAHVFPTKSGFNKTQNRPMEGQTTHREGNDAIPFNMFQFGMASSHGETSSSDFQFAIPLAPSPGRLGKCKSPKNHQNQSYRTEDSSIKEMAPPFLSFSSPDSQMSRNEEPKTPSFGFGERDSSFATLFGSGAHSPSGTMDFSTSNEKNPAPQEFRGFGDDEPSSGAFASFFGFGSSGGS